MESRSEAEFPIISDYANWLVETTQQIGFGQADRPTGYGDIKSWCYFSGLELTPFEAETIVSLCSTYLAGTQKYRDKEILPPFRTEKSLAKITSTNMSSWQSIAVTK